MLSSPQVVNMSSLLGERLLDGVLLQEQCQGNYRPCSLRLNQFSIPEGERRGEHYYG